MLYTHVAAAVVALAVGFGGAWKVQAWRWEAADAERIETTAEAERLRRIAQDSASERNDRETSSELARAHAAALAARGDLERLLHAAGGVASQQESASSCSDDGRLELFARLLAEGAILVEEGGRRVAELAAEKAALQRHAADQP